MTPSGNPLPIPEEDSTDLTDLEIAKAVPTTGVSDIVDQLRQTPCGTCESQAGIHRHTVRRRKPHLYWRVELRCGAGHENRITFLTDWLKGDAP